ACFGFADVEQPEVSSKTRHSQHTQRSREWSNLRIDLSQLGSFRQVEKSPAHHAGNDVAILELGRARFDNLRHRAAAYHVAHFKRRNVGATRAHASAQVRVNRNVKRTQ